MQFRYPFLYFQTILFIAVGFFPCATFAAPPKPNIIFILSDDLGYGELGCFGQKDIKTPCLDKMASEGMKFTDAYAGCAVCAPSRCTLMTGLHTGHARFRGNRDSWSLRADPQDVTVAELLHKAGYATALVGKWGLGIETSPGAPNKKGFDESFGYLDQVHAHFYYTDHLIKNGQRFEIPENANGAKKVYSHDLFTAAALDYVQTNKDRPFFLYLAYTIPHFNMEVPDDAPYEHENWPPVEIHKAAMITRMDRDIGRLFDKLKELNIDSNTLVFFTSDNGPHIEGGVDARFFHAGGPLRGHKRDLFEGGIREPTLARWPGVIKPGSVSHFPWAFWDFLPTACELAGAATPPGLDGQSIVPTLMGQSQTPPPFMYWEFHEGGSIQAVRMGDWKEIKRYRGKTLLYNLKTDLGETHSVAAQHPDIVAKIEEYLKTARTPDPAWPMVAAKKKNH